MYQQTAYDAVCFFAYMPNMHCWGAAYLAYPASGLNRWGFAPVRNLL
jgi:hypothetical protein